MPKTTIERFWAKVDKTPSCWTWTGYIQPNGYPKFRYDGQAGYAHRFAYEALVGQIPDGLTIDHLCNTPSCVRPDHLRLATQQENIARSNGLPAQNRNKTHCIHGHSLEDAYRTKAGHRVCRPCVANRSVGRTR